MKDLSKLTNEDTFLVIPVGYKDIILERFDGPSSLKMVEEFGFELFLHCGAIRKALLAFQSKDFIEDYINFVLKSEDLPKKVDSHELLSFLNTIKRDAYATSSGDYVEGTVGVSQN